MELCRTCEYWTQHNIGDCSQNNLTTEGIFVKCRTVGTYGCTSHKESHKKFHLSVWQDDKDKVHLSGILQANFLKKIIDECQIKIKELSR